MLLFTKYVTNFPYENLYFISVNLLSSNELLANTTYLAQVENQNLCLGGGRVGHFKNCIPYWKQSEFHAEENYIKVLISGKYTSVIPVKTKVHKNYIRDERVIEQE